MIGYETFFFLKYIYYILAAISILAYISTGIYIFKENRDSLTSRYFSIFCFNIAIYNFSVFFLFLVPDKEWARTVMHLNSTFGPLVPISFYLFLKSVSDPNYNITKDIMLRIYVALCVVAILGFNYHEIDAEIISHPRIHLENNKEAIWFFPEYTNWQYFFCAIYLIIMAHSIYNIRTSMSKTSSPVTKRFLKELIFFTAACSVVGLEDTLFVSRDAGWFPFSPVSGIIYLCFILYALLKYRFIEIQIEGNNIATFIMAIVLSVLVIAAAVPFFILLNNYSLYFILIGAILIALNYLRKLRPENPQRKMNYSLNEKKVQDINLIKTYLIDLIRKDESEKVRIELFSNKTVDKTNIINLIIDEEKKSDIESISSVMELIDYMQKNMSQLDYTLISRMPFKERQTLIMAMGLINASICLPLIYGSNITGLIIIEKNVIGELYTDREILNLNAFSQVASIAIENTRLLKQQHNIIMDISHELRTPLTAIRLYAQYLKKKVSSRVNLKNAVQLILTENERYQNIISNLLDVLRLDEESSLGIITGQVDLNDIAEQSMSLFYLVLEEKGIHEELIKGEDIPKIICDKEKIKQVIINLLSNSMKYTKAGGKITLRVLMQDGVIKVEVKDTGIGIAEKDRPNLFARQFRTDQARKVGAGGAGIGLTICNKIINQHGGKIGVESQENQGSTFWFTLPINGDQYATKKIIDKGEK